MQITKWLEKIEPDAFSSFQYCQISIPNSCTEISLPSKTKVKFYDPKATDSQQNTQQADQEKNENLTKDNSCTYAHTGCEIVYQELFTCTTCKLQNDECICKACAKICHAGHNTHSLGFNQGFCDRGAGNLSCHCNCNNLQQSAFIPGPCTFNKTGTNYEYQHFYKCLTCRFSDSAGCCDFCAKTCHLGHDLVYHGIVKSYCDCGAGEEIRCQIPVIKLIK